MRSGIFPTIRPEHNRCGRAGSNGKTSPISATKVAARHVNLPSHLVKAPDASTHAIVFKGIISKLREWHEIRLIELQLSKQQKIAAGQPPTPATSSPLSRA
jgi:hypothetical protein